MARRAWCAFVLLAVVAAPSRAADDLGVNVAFYGRAHEQLDALSLAGVRWVRLDLDWSTVEHAPGRYDFSLWDRLFDAFEPRGIRTLLVLDYGNPLYEGGFPPSTDEGRGAFAAFAGAAAKRYRGRAAWEIWNEPNVPRFWVGAPDPAAYVALARAAAAAIRREDPQAWILGPGAGGDQFDAAYLEATFRLGLLEVVDAVSIHPYGASHPEAAPALYERTRSLMRQYGRLLPLVVSEWGYPVEGLGLEGQADALRRCLAVNRAAGIPLTIWFNWQEPVGSWHSFGLLDVRGRPKPAYHVLGELAAAESAGARARR